MTPKFSILLKILIIFGRTNYLIFTICRLLSPGNVFGPYSVFFFFGTYSVKKVIQFSFRICIDSLKYDASQNDIHKNEVIRSIGSKCKK